MDPDVIRRVHRDYLAAGADCLISATYQATVAGFRKRGLSPEEARSLIVRAVELATHERDAFWQQRPPGRQRPLVAASVGPYGAYLADGSEYTGDYDRDEEGLYAFHRQRFRLLAASGADLLACETLPSLAEARALLRLLGESAGTWAWLSFSCRDGGRLADGSEIAEAAALVDAAERAVAVGVNCTAPRFVPELVDAIRRATAKPIVVYPNSGELYDVGSKRWLGRPDPGDFADAAMDWVGRGATLVGGCCRTGPEHVRQIRRRLVG